MRVAIALAVVLTALPAAVPAQDHPHGAQAHGDELHSHRGPGPHFVDAFFTENAYLERKLRPDVVYAASDEGSRTTFQLEGEWAVARRVAFIVHAPVHRLAPTGAPAETGIGDVTVGAKLALVNDPRRFILAVGADAELPTGDATRGLGEEHAAAAPFLLAWLPFGPERRWLAQGAVHTDIPLAGADGAHWETSAALSWTSPLGVTPIVEIGASFATREEVAWFAAPEFRWEVGPAWEVGAAVRLPIGGPRHEDYRIALGAIRHFRWCAERGGRGGRGGRVAPTLAAPGSRRS